MILGPTDRLEIGELAVQYGQNFDAGDGAACAALFAADGWFEVRDGMRLSGTQAIKEFVDAAHVRMPTVRHFPGQPVLQVSDDGTVRGRSSVFALRVDEQQVLRLLAVGDYLDAYVRCTDGWRIQCRRLESWLPPQLADVPLVPAARGGAVGG